MKHIFYSLILTILVLPSITLASPIVRSGDTVSIEADQILGGDFYGAGGTVVISGEAEGDVYVAGGTVTQNSVVKEDLVIVGGTVQIHGEVVDDLRIVGGEVTIANKISGDVVILGGTVQILSTAEIGGDLLFMAGNLDVNGSVQGSIAGVADTLRIDAGVGGDVDVTAEKLLTFGGRAEVQGDVIYKSSAEAARAQDAVIVGTITKQSLLVNGNVGRYAVLPFLIILFAALTAYLLFKRHIQKITDTTEVSYGINGLIGLGVLFGGPMLAVLLMVSVLGIIPGIVAFLLYLLLLLVAWVLGGIVFGTMVMKIYTKSSNVTLSTTIFGVALMHLILFVPYIGALVWLAVFLIVLGGITRLLYKAV